MSNEDEGTPLDPAADEPIEIVISMPGNRAIVFGSESGTEVSRLGRWVGDLVHGEWRSLARTLDEATKAYIEAQQWTGRLVELDETSRAMWDTAKKVVDADGWVQANLRNDKGHISRLMRVRPATAARAAVSATSVLGAIATQAQAAEMAREMREIRAGVNDVRQHQRSDLLGAADNAIEQVSAVVERLRMHGIEGVNTAELAVLSNAIGDVSSKSMRHLDDAVGRLEAAKSASSPRAAAKALPKEVREEVAAYLDVAGGLYSGTLQIGLAKVAYAFQEGKPDVAQTLAGELVAKSEKLRHWIDGVASRVEQVDASVRGLLETERPVGAAGLAAIPAGAAAAAAVEKFARGRTVKVRGFEVPLSGLAAAGAAVAGGAVERVDAATQARAAKKLDKGLRLIADVTSRTASTLGTASAKLQDVQALARELTASAGGADGSMLRPAVP